MKKDWLIELVRFTAACSIAIFHFEWIYLGQPVYFRHFYLWVEFFYVLSGFFLASKILIEKNENMFSPIIYVTRQTKKLWKPYIFAFFFSFAVYCVVNKISDFGSFAATLFAGKWEAFFMHLSGFDSGAPLINGVTGYIPALLAASLIVFYLGQNHYSLLVNVIIPLAPVFIYAHIINVYGNLSQWMAFEGWYTVGICRGLAGVLVGAGAYIYGKNKCSGALPGILGIPAIMAIAALVFFRDYISYRDELLYPYVFAVLIAVIFFRKRHGIHAVIERGVLLLGKISYNIFLLHYGICYLFLQYYPGKAYGKTALLYMLAVLSMGLGMELLMAKLFRNKQA